MEILIQVLQFFMSLTLLVAVHEFGHFIVARLFKIRVEKFYIFFDWGFSLWKKKKGDTEYGLGWLPLGGYCKIAGMVDESMDKEQLASAPQPWEYRAKPAWQRFLVLVAGVTMNVVLAFFIYTGICFTYGTKYTSNEDIKYGYQFNSNGKSLGFEDGDRIVSIDGERIKDVQAIFSKLLLADGDLSVKVVRNGAEQTFTVDYSKLNRVRQSDEFVQYGPLVPCVIDSVASETAVNAGLQTGDRLVAIKGEKEVLHIANREEQFSRFKDSTAVLSVVRGVDTLNVNVPVNAEGKIGVTLKEYKAEDLIKMHRQTYGFFESFVGGARLTGRTIKSYWDQLALIVQPETRLYNKVGGFVSIGSFFPKLWDWERFWSMTAFLSIILAVMNIIPIPGLDGGHMLFTFWEMITRRKVSEKVLTIAQYIGMGLILALVLFANGNDLFKLIFK